MSRTIEEPRPGVYSLFLLPTSCQALREVLRPVPDSVVWLVGYRPHPPLAWIDLPVPLAPDQPAELLRVRTPSFDVQLPLADFLDRLPRMHARAGMLAVQMARPVPDTLSYQSVSARPEADAILRQNGWLLTFYLPHDGETALVETDDRAWLEHLAAVPGLGLDAR